MMRNNIITLLLATAIFTSCNQVNRQEIAESAAEEIPYENTDANYEVAPNEQKLKGPVAMKGMKGSSNKTDKNSRENNSIINDSLYRIKIIHTGEISIESSNVNKTLSNLSNTIKNLNGYYEDEFSSLNDNYSNHHITIRIPNNKFLEFVNQLENSDDKLTEKKIEAKDVSLLYYDGESRIKTKRAYLAKYQSMIPAAKNIEELLNIQSQIMELQEDIESKEATFRQLKQQITFSTIKIHIYASKGDGNNLYFFKEVKQALSNGIGSLRNLIIHVIQIWPLYLTVTLVLLVWPKYKKIKASRTNILHLIFPFLKASV